MKYKKREVDDPYLNDLKMEFNHFSSDLRKLKQMLLKSTSAEEQSQIIKKMDTLSTKMENNQKQATKVTKSRLENKKKLNKKRT